MLSPPVREASLSLSSSGCWRAACGLLALLACCLPLHTIACCEVSATVQLQGTAVHALTALFSVTCMQLGSPCWYSGRGLSGQPCHVSALGHAAAGTGLCTGSGATQRASDKSLPGPAVSLSCCPAVAHMRHIRVICAAAVPGRSLLRKVAWPAEAQTAPAQAGTLQARCRAAQFF